MLRGYLLGPSAELMTLNRESAKYVRQGSLLYAVICHDRPKGPKVPGRPLGDGDNDDDDAYGGLDVEILCWCESRQLAQAILDGLRNGSPIMGVVGYGRKKLYGLREMEYPTSSSLQAAYETAERLATEWTDRAILLKKLMDEASRNG